MTLAKIFRHVLLSGLFFIACLCACQGATPGWWCTSNVIVDPDSDDFAVANAGQLKHIASAARNHLDFTLQPTCVEWGDAYNINGGPDPFPFTNTDNFKPLNQGQLKFVASGFYQIMQDKGLDTNAMLNLNMPAGEFWGEDFPWTADTADDNDFAPVQLGQIKWVFGFDLGTFDDDSDMLPDAWEILHFDDLAQVACNDPNLDGLTLLQEFNCGLDPQCTCHVGCCGPICGGGTCVKYEYYGVLCGCYCVIFEDEVPGGLALTIPFSLFPFEAGSGREIFAVRHRLPSPVIFSPRGLFYASLATSFVNDFVITPADSYAVNIILPSGVGVKYNVPAGESVGNPIGRNLSQAGVIKSAGNQLFQKSAHFPFALSALAASRFSALSYCHAAPAIFILA